MWTFKTKTDLKLNKHLQQTTYFVVWHWIQTYEGVNFHRDTFVEIIFKRLIVLVYSVGAKIIPMSLEWNSCTLLDMCPNSKDLMSRMLILKS